MCAFCKWLFFSSFFISDSRGWCLSAEWWFNAMPSWNPSVQYCRDFRKVSGGPYNCAPNATPSQFPNTVERRRGLRLIVLWISKKLKLYLKFLIFNDWAGSKMTMNIYFNFFRLFLRFWRKEWLQFNEMIAVQAPEFRVSRIAISLTERLNLVKSNQIRIVITL